MSDTVPTVYDEPFIGLRRALHEAAAGQRHYSSQPPEVKAICRGLKRSLILKNFATAGELKEYLETMGWQ